MNITVRKATLCDAHALCRLNGEGMGYEYPAEKTAENLKATLEKEYERVFVAEVCGETVGYIHACIYGLLFAEMGINILGIAVAENYTRKGVGRALMNELENWARTQGAAYIRLVSGESRHGAHAFYEKCGYKSNKTQKNYKKKL